MLVPPESFAEQPPRAASFDRAADFFAGDHAEPGRAAIGQLVPIGDEAALREPFALPAGCARNRGFARAARRGPVAGVSAVRRTWPD